MLNVRVALAVAVVGVLSFATGLILLVGAARSRPVDAELADVARVVLSLGSVATVAGSLFLARAADR